MKRLVLIGARATGSSVSLVQLAIRESFAVTIIVDERVQLDRRAFPDGVDIVNLRADEKTVSEWISHRYRPGEQPVFVTTAHDLYARLAANVAESLKLPGPPAAPVSQAVSKAAQKRILASAGLPTTRAIVIAHDTLRDLDRQLLTLRAPFVVKPSEGSASDGVKLCDDAAAAKAHIAKLFDADGGERAGRHVLVEEFVTGHEYCVEFFDGRYVGAMRKIKSDGIGFIERAYTAELDLDAAGIAHLIEVTTAAVQAACLTWGPVHVDCIMSHGVPYVVELNPRIAGSFICDIVRDSYGFDPVAALLEKIQGRPVDIPRVTGPLGYARVDFILETDPPSWDFPEAGSTSSPGVSIRFGPQRLSNRQRRAFLYTRFKTGTAFGN